MLPIIRRLHARGHGVHVVGTLGANVGRIAEMSRRARAYLEAEDLRDVVIVAHSKGGLIGKPLVAFGDPDRRIRAMVAINAPFGGSSYARLFPVRSIRDFSPRNAALVELGRSRAVNARITSLFARFDPHIPGGSALDGATDERVRASGHFRIMGDEDVLRASRPRSTGPGPRPHRPPDPAPGAAHTGHMPDPAAPARGGGSADGHPDGTADGRGRTALAVAILASFVAFLDGTVVNVALPAIGEDLGGGLIVQQWVVVAYLITLGALILLAGSLSDAFGRVRVLRWGLVGFGVTSLVCAIAPTAVILIAARAAQGAAGALLVPSSLALIAQAFRGPAQARAIGSWTAWTGTAMLVGPVLGGVLVDALDWRLVFGINVLPIAVTLVLLARLPHDAPVADGTRVDVPGAVLGALGIGGPVFALIEQSRLGIGHPLVVGSLVVGVACLVLFVVRERRTAHPMLPLSLFRERDFLVGNIATIGIYGALSLGGFVIAVFLQQTGGLSATAAGFALVPTTVIMLLLSTRFGALAGRIGPRLLMGAGPIVAGGGYLLMLRVAEPVDYWGQLLPGILVFGLGLSMTVAPLTATILEAVPPAQAGIASAVNNAVSRVAGLVAIDAIGLVAGPDLDVAAFHRVVLVTAALLIAGGLVSLVGIRSRRAVAAAPASGDAAG